MGGHTLHTLLPALRLRVTAVHQHNDRLYLGTATGVLQVYSFNTSTSGAPPRVELVKTHTLGKRPIDQIIIAARTGQLLVLSDTIVTAYPLDDLSAKAKVLTQARYAHHIAVVPYNPLPVKGKGKDTGSEVTENSGNLVDMILIGCRKKVVVFPGVKAGFKEAWELALPHSPRHVIVPTSPRSVFPGTAHLLYSSTSSVILHISAGAPHLVVSELGGAPPPPPTGIDQSAVSGEADKEGTTASGGIGIGSLGGLGGYVGLGGKAPTPTGTSTAVGEVLLGREELGVFVSSEGHYTRPNSLRWSAAPEQLVYRNPFLYSATPGLAAASAPQDAVQPAIHVHLVPTLLHRRALHLPPHSTGSSSISCMSSCQTGSSTAAEGVAAAAQMLFVSTPLDKALALAEGSSVWTIQGGDLGDEVDDLVREGRVADAIGLVESVGESGFPPQQRLRHLKILAAVSDFALGRYQNAIETFLLYNVNPALVISLFPAETISGRLHAPRDQWMELFGATPGARLAPAPLRTASADDQPSRGVLKSVAAVTGLGALTKRSSGDSLRSTAAASAAGSRIVAAGKETEVSEKVPVMNDEEIPRAAMEALMYYLSDRRQKLTGAINALKTPLPAESSLPPLSALAADELHGMPSVPLTDFEPDQLLRIAQIIYTALLKVYLVARPILVGSLCRIENWCDVEEVEELLKAQKFSDLIDLYQGKKMHDKALRMLHQLAKDEEDRLDRYPPTVRYLQKLGPGGVDMIFEHSTWIFHEDPDMGIQIFTADEPEVEALPRSSVTVYLEKTHEPSCIRYLEHIINSLHEEGAAFHDTLAELYLASSSRADKEELKIVYAKLVDFLSSSRHYRANRIIGKLVADGMPEARAILLGRMGKHEEALRIYVYRLQDFSAAERYCARVFSASSSSDSEKDKASDIFLTLLRLYLRPASSDPVLLEPALELIAKHSPRLDAEQVLALLPPLVTMRDVQDFFVKTLREKHVRRSEREVVRELVTARKEEVERALMGLQTRRVRVTDQRICPQCHKRLGQSAIAVHAPRGEVTHLHCKDPFSAHLARARG